MCICSLEFTTFAVSLSLVANRLQLSFILLLSNITFKFVIGQSLPKVSYLTILVSIVLLYVIRVALASSLNSVTCLILTALDSLIKTSCTCSSLTRLLHSGCVQLRML